MKRDMENSGWKEKLQNLQSQLLTDTKNAVGVAFSGGVDSSLLLMAAKKSMEESRKIYAVTFDTMLHPACDLENAKKVAEEAGVAHKILFLNELEQADIRYNPVNRCYLCKKALFQRLKEFADSEGISLILEGTNEDDLHVYRPGLQAVRELGIISPLADAGFTKKEVRQLAAELGVSVADRPSTPCLATRLPYGAEIKAEVLEQIEKGEEFLKKEGFCQVRLRLHGEIARIEIPQKDFSRFLDKRERIAEQLKKMGFSYITLDIQGFRSGSMDENLKKL